MRKWWQPARRIADLGFYDTVMDEDEYRAIRADAAAVEGLWQRLAGERLERWIDHGRGAAGAGRDPLLCRPVATTT